MANKQRRTELYSIFLIDKQMRKDYKGKIKLFDIIKSFLENYKTTNKNTHVFEINSNNDIVYWFGEYEKDEKNSIIKLKMNYSIYNKELDIINVTTLKKTGQKNKNEGDKERQHLVIKYYPTYNKCVMVFEKINGAVTISSLGKEINEYLNLSTKFKSNGLEILIKSIPNPDFIEELKKTNRINLLRVTVDRQKANIDEDFDFAEKGISRKTIDIIYKPAIRASFSKNKILNYYNKFKDNNNNNKVNRIVIEGYNKSGKMRLDTEGIKLAKYINTKIDMDGLIKTSSIFEKYTSFIIDEFQDYIVNTVLDQVASEREE